MTTVFAGRETNRWAGIRSFFPEAVEEAGSGGGADEGLRQAGERKTGQDGGPGLEVGGNIESSRAAGASYDGEAEM